MSTTTPPPDGALLHSQRAAILQAVVELGLDASDFRWEDRLSAYVSNKWATIVTHEPSGYKMVFDWESYRNNNRMVIMSPAEETSERKQVHGSWTSAMKECRLWLQRLKREVDAIDTFDSLIAQGNLIQAAAQSTANTPFTLDEQTTLFERLDEIEKRIAETHSLGSQEREYLASQMEYLKEASRRVGRKDWFLIFAATLAGLAANTAISSNVVRSALEMVSSALLPLLTN